LQQQTENGLTSLLETNLPSGSTVADLLKHLQVDLNPDAVLLVVNGRVVGLEFVLNEGDRVNIMPVISGGI
jgi:sulfur carrier protein ThiS